MANEGESEINKWTPPRKMEESREYTSPSRETKFSSVNGYRGMFILRSADHKQEYGNLIRLIYTLLNVMEHTSIQNDTSSAQDKTID